MGPSFFSWQRQQRQSYSWLDEQPYIPDLLTSQRESFEMFLRKGLTETFTSHSYEQFVDKTPDYLLFNSFGVDEKAAKKSRLTIRNYLQARKMAFLNRTLVDRRVREPHGLAASNSATLQAYNATSRRPAVQLSCTKSRRRPVAPNSVPAELHRWHGGRRGAISESNSATPKGYVVKTFDPGGTEVKTCGLRGTELWSPDSTPPGPHHGVALRRSRDVEDLRSRPRSLRDRRSSTKMWDRVWHGVRRDVERVGAQPSSIWGFAGAEFGVAGRRREDELDNNTFDTAYSYIDDKRVNHTFFGHESFNQQKSYWYKSLLASWYTLNLKKNLLLRYDALGYAARLRRVVWHNPDVEDSPIGSRPRSTSRRTPCQRWAQPSSKKTWGRVYMPDSTRHSSTTNSARHRPAAPQEPSFAEPQTRLLRSRRSMIWGQLGCAAGLRRDEAPQKPSLIKWKQIVQNSFHEILSKSVVIPFHFWTLDNSLMHQLLTQFYSIQARGGPFLNQTDQGTYKAQIFIPMQWSVLCYEKVRESRWRMSNSAPRHRPAAPNSVPTGPQVFYEDVEPSSGRTVGTVFDVSAAPQGYAMWVSGLRRKPAAPKEPSPGPQVFTSSTCGVAESDLGPSGAYRWHGVRRDVDRFTRPQVEDSPMGWRVRLDCAAGLRRRSRLIKEKTWTYNVSPTFFTKGPTFSLPMMNDRGVFIVNGVSRCLLNQRSRLPGVYMCSDIQNTTKKNQIRSFRIQFISQRGPSIKIFTEEKSQLRLWIQIGDHGIIPLFLFLSGLGFTRSHLLSWLKLSFIHYLEKQAFDDIQKLRLPVLKHLPHKLGCAAGLRRQWVGSNSAMPKGYDMKTFDSEEVDPIPTGPQVFNVRHGVATSRRRPAVPDSAAPQGYAVGPSWGSGGAEFEDVYQVGVQPIQLRWRSPTLSGVPTA